MVALIYGVAAVLPFFHTHRADRVELYSSASAPAARTSAIPGIATPATATAGCPICLLHQMTSGQIQAPPAELASDFVVAWTLRTGKVSPRQSLLYFASARAPPIA